MGMPENMSAEEIKHLKGKSQPEILVEYRDLKGKYKTKFQLPAHGIEMVVLEKQI